MKKLKLISTILLISLMSALFIMPASAIEDPAPEASSVVLLDIETGNYLYSKNSNTQAAPASLTKIMTVMLAIEDIELGLVSPDDIVTASGNMTFDLIAEGSTSGIVAGEAMPLIDLLYCALVESANEACNIIAEYISGSIEKFVARMNSRASELGCTGTNFTNTHGLPASGHYTTADDIALISRAAISHPMFAEICNTATITIAATNLNDARHLKNTNGLINKDSEIYPGYYYEYAAGVKTGHTEAAGYCLVSTASKDGINLLCVVMGGKATHLADGTDYGNFTDSITMYNWAFENYSYRDILKVTDIVQDVKVNMGRDTDFVSLHPQTAVRALLPNDDDLQSFIQKKTIFSEESGEELVAPIEAGEVLGEIYMERDGVVYGSSVLVAKSSVGLDYTKYIAENVGETLKKPAIVITVMVLLLLLIGYFFLVVRYSLLRRKYVKEQRAKASRETAAAGAGYQDGAPYPSPEQEVVGLAATPGRQRPASNKATLSKALKDYKPNQSFEAPAGDNKAQKDYFEEFFGKKD